MPRSIFNISCTRHNAQLPFWELSGGQHRNDHNVTLTKICWDLWLWICGLVSLAVIFDSDSFVCAFWFAISFCGLGFVISGSGSLVWDFWFEIFALKPLVSNLCVELISLVWIGIFGLGYLLWDMWLGTFGLASLVCVLWFEIFGLGFLVCVLRVCGASVYYLRSGIFGLGAWFGISGVRSLALYLWSAIFDYRSLDWDLRRGIFGCRSLVSNLWFWDLGQEHWAPEAGRGAGR